MELFCPDGICADDACSQEVCKDGMCVRKPLSDGTPCDDGRYCTVGDRCLAGACWGRTWRSCGGDGVSTLSFCDEAQNQCFVRELPQETKPPDKREALAQPAPVPVFEVPLPGDILHTSGENLVIVRLAQGAVPGIAYDVTYTFTPDDGQPVIVAAEPVSTQQWGVLQHGFDPTGFAGSGHLGVTVRDPAGQEGHAAVRVLINQSPRPVLQIAAWEPIGKQRGKLVLDASQSVDPDGRIVTYRMDLSVGGEIVSFTEPRVSYNLEWPHEDPVITLTVGDDQAGSASATYVLARTPKDPKQPVYLVPGEQKKDCGCRFMVLALSGPGTGFFNYFAPHNIPAAFLLPGQPGPLGPHIELKPRGRGYLAWNWEIVVVLDPRTTDMDACQEFQLARGTAFNRRAMVPNPPSLRTPANVPGVVGGVPMPPVVPPRAPYPTFRGGQYGRDNYTRGQRPGGLKLHSPPILILWSDRAGQHPPPPGVGAPAADFAEFYSVVSGNLGTCVGHFLHGLLVFPNGNGAAIDVRRADSTRNFFVLP